MEIKDLLCVEAVMTAMTRFASCQSEEDAAREAYEGYSWGWAGERWIAATIEAKQRAQEVLDNYVKAVVKRELKAHGMNIP